MQNNKPSSTIKDRTGGWNQGSVQHIIPTVNHERFLIKISLQAAVAEAPRLSVDDKLLTGSRTDLAGACFQFDVKDLQPASTYELQLVDVDSLWQVTKAVVEAARESLVVGQS
jgi:hypothetical protein